MFAHFALGTQARSAAHAVDEDPSLSPKQKARQLPISTIPTGLAVERLTPDDDPPVPPQPIGSLIHGLSQPQLFPDGLGRPRLPSTSSQTSNSIVAGLSAVALEADEDCQMDLSMDDVKEHQPVADWKRSRRQWQSRFAHNPSNARAIQARLKDMILEKSQCNVHPAPASLISRPISANSAQSTIEPDTSRQQSSPTSPGTDEVFCGQSEPYQRPRPQATSNGQLAGASDVQPRYGMLRFRGSAETALRCQNVVKQRPRMRKRKGPGPTTEPRHMRFQTYPLGP